MTVLKPRCRADDGYEFSRSCSVCVLIGTATCAVAMNVAVVTYADHLSLNCPFGRALVCQGGIDSLRPGARECCADGITSSVHTVSGVASPTKCHFIVRIAMDVLPCYLSVAVGCAVAVACRFFTETGLCS